MLASLEGKPNSTFEPPEGVVSASVDVVSGYREHDGFPSRSEFFIKGTEPGEDPVHKMLEVCRGDNNKLATAPDIARGTYDLKEYFVFREDDPTSEPGGVNRFMEGINKWLETQSEPKYHPPTEYCNSGSTAPINIDFIEPRDTNSDLNNEVKVRFVIDFIHEITEAWLEVDGTRVRTFTSGPYEHTVNLPNGPHTLRAAAKDSEGNESERVIRIGVKSSWETPTPSPSPTPTP